MKSKSNSKRAIIITLSILIITALVLLGIKSPIFSKNEANYTIEKAKILLQNNQVNAAYSHISKLILEDSTNSQALIFRAKLHEDARRFENALSDLKKAESLESDKAYIYERFGVLNAKLNRLDESLFYLNKANDLNPLNTNLQNNLGISYSLMEEYDSALISFNQAIEIEPKNNQARLNRANLYFTISDYENAKEDLQYLKKIQPNNFPISFRLGLIELKKGNLEEGLKLIRPLAVTTNKAAQIAERLVSAQFYKESLEFYKIAIGDKGLKEKMFFQRAEVYHQLGEFQNAIDDLLVIVETMPEAAVFYKIGVLYFNLENMVKACEFWSEASTRKHEKAQELLDRYCSKSLLR